MLDRSSILECELIESKNKNDTEIGFYYRKLNGKQYHNRFVFEIVARDIIKNENCGYFEFFQNKATSARLKQLNPRIPKDKLIFSNIEVFENYRENGLSKLLVKNGLSKLKNSGQIHVVRFFDEEAMHAMVHQFSKIDYKQLYDDVLALYKTY